MFRALPLSILLPPVRNSWENVLHLCSVLQNGRWNLRPGKAPEEASLPLGCSFHQHAFPTLLLHPLIRRTLAHRQDTLDSANHRSASVHTDSCGGPASAIQAIGWREGSSESSGSEELLLNQREEKRERRENAWSGVGC